MQEEKTIIFNSGAGNVLIENKLSHFQNSIFDPNYLNPIKNHSITPREIYMDVNFKNPICPENNAFPSLICVPYFHLAQKSPYEIDDFKLEFFYNVHKYYLDTAKKYTMLDLFTEWSAKEKLAIKTRKLYNDQLGEDHVPLYTDSELATTTNFLKDTGSSIIFGQHAIEENYEIRENEKTMLLFHFKFAEKLGIENQIEKTAYINQEKYYMLLPDSEPIEVSHENKGLLFETPKILQVKCKNISSYPSDSEYCKTIGVININKKNEYSAFHHTFKGNDFYPLESKVNKDFEVLVTNEHGKRIQIYQGVPTILTVSVIEGKMENEENIICTSRKSIVHPHNNPTEFTSILAKPYIFNKEWKVALSAVIVKNDFKYDSNLIFQFSYTQFDPKGDELVRRTVKIDENVKTIKEIFEKFTEVLNRHVDDDNPDEENSHKVGFVRVSSKGILTIRFNFATKFSFTPHLAMVLGITNHPFDSATIDYHSESVKLEIGFENSILTGGIFIASTPIDFNFNLNQKFMFITMDAIKDVPVGDGNGRVLKIVSLSNEEQGDYVKKDFDILDWHPLEYHHIQSIKFKLLAQSGSLLKIRNSADYCVSWLQLIFKKFPKTDTL